MVDINVAMQEVNQAEGVSFRAVEPESPFIVMYSGEYHGHGTLKLGFEASFPYSLPSIFVSPVPTMRLHIDDKGKICLTDESSLLLDTKKPAQLITECLKLAERVLNLSPDDPQYQAELKREFMSYWGLQGNGSSIWSILSIADCQSIHKIPLFPVGKSYILAPSLSDANSFICDYLGLSPIETYKGNLQYAWVIRLKEGASLLSPFENLDWSSIIRYVKNNSNQETRQKFWDLTSTPVTKAVVRLIFVVPAIDAIDGDIVFGVSVLIKNRYRLPIKASLSKAVSRVNVMRYDYDFLLSRCGSTPSLKDKRVLLLGCGSVGGFLANNLCQMGVTQLDLLDKDTFSVHNVYRHFMGFETIKQERNSYKADSLRNWLTNKYPYVDIDSLNYVDRAVEKVILKNHDRLRQYDLIISALGEPTLNLAINDLLIQQQIQVPFIVCFNEPYGVGGHVIVTNISDESCLHCFYSDPIYGGLCSFRGSLVDTNQNFKKTLSGCSGMFVPYSTLDSQQTAIYTARKAVDVLTGKLTHNDFFTWRGDASLLISQGFRVSEYFFADSVPEHFSNPNCPICQGRNGSLL